jgi:hypothetical protein
MDSRWMFSVFNTDPLINMMAPVASAYGNGWQCPVFPTTEGGWALVQVLCDSNQIAAAAQDNRVIVCPLLYDPSPLPQTITDAYAAQGATPGMSIGALISKLASTEPVYAITLTA